MDHQDQDVRSKPTDHRQMTIFGTRINDEKTLIAAVLPISKVVVS